MKSLLLSPQSAKQIKPISMENKPSQIKEESESNYFLGCRKDANCNCKMCLESITATLDLMPMSVQRSSLTKLSVSKPSRVAVTPVSIDPTILSTPVSRPSPPIVEEVASSSKTMLQSTIKTGFSKVTPVVKNKFGVNLKLSKWVLIFGLILGLEFGFSCVVPRVLQPKLSKEIVRDVVQESSGVENLSERLVLIQNGLNVSVHGKLSSCLLGDSGWKVHQDGLIKLSYCILYQSAAEEVLIWGWPLQTSGLLTSGFSSRAFNVVCGRITEWPEGNIISVVRDPNTTWFLDKWSASVVQFEPNSWMIECKRNSLLENRSIMVLAVKFTKFRISKLLQRLQQHLWHLVESEATGLSIPT